MTKVMCNSRLFTLFTALNEEGYHGLKKPVLLGDTELKDTQPNFVGASFTASVCDKVGPYETGGASIIYTFSCRLTGSVSSSASRGTGSVSTVTIIEGTVRL